MKYKKAETILEENANEYGLKDGLIAHERGGVLKSMDIYKDVYAEAVKEEIVNYLNERCINPEDESDNFEKLVNMLNVEFVNEKIGWQISSSAVGCSAKNNGA